jgi:hypothetical protein
MSDSAFWRDLVTRFRELQKEQRGDGLRAEWYYIDHQWLLRGGPNASILRRFKQAVEHAVRRLGIEPDTKAQLRGASALNTWLNFLRTETDAFRAVGESVERIDGKSAKTIASAKKIAALWGRRPGTMRGIDGVIARVCEVSADYCEHLADVAEEPELPPIARNIEKFRRESGWSLDQLAEKTNLGKKLVLAHVHGKTKPRPSTVKVYSVVFSKALGRKITPGILEELR